MCVRSQLANSLSAATMKISVPRTFLFVLVVVGVLAARPTLQDASQYPPSPSASKAGSPPDVRPPTPAAESATCRVEQEQQTEGGHVYPSDANGAIGSREDSGLPTEDVRPPPYNSNDSQAGSSQNSNEHPRSSRGHTSRNPENVSASTGRRRRRRSRQRSPSSNGGGRSLRSGVCLPDKATNSTSVDKLQTQDPAPVVVAAVHFPPDLQSPNDVGPAVFCMCAWLQALLNLAALGLKSGFSTCAELIIGEASVRAALDTQAKAIGATKPCQTVTSIPAEAETRTSQQTETLPVSSRDVSGQTAVAAITNTSAPSSRQVPAAWRAAPQRPSQAPPFAPPPRPPFESFMSYHLPYCVGGRHVFMVREIIQFAKEKILVPILETRKSRNSDAFMPMQLGHPQQAFGGPLLPVEGPRARYQEIARTIRDHREAVMIAVLSDEWIPTYSGLLYRQSERWRMSQLEVRFAHHVLYEFLTDYHFAMHTQEVCLGIWDIRPRVMEPGEQALAAPWVSELLSRRPVTERQHESHRLIASVQRAHMDLKAIQLEERKQLVRNLLQAPDPLEPAIVQIPPRPQHAAAPTPTPRTAANSL
ncbi:hypothetical protein Efla_003064 [Eimeria flavescens]